ncbi:MAG: hypothetical protein J5790_07640 [Bacteroidaceae bacterium]|nr:hypothetical protein [Bacteroidaceae bacterium]
MKEIKLYHKVWMFLPVLLIMLALTIVYLIPIIRGNNSSYWIWNWFLLLFSGSFFLWGLFAILRERVLHKPALTITEDKVIVNGKKEYHFADIHHFALIEYPGLYISTNVISIHYMPSVETKKMSEAKGIDRIYRKMNVAMMNAQDSIQVTNLTMKPQQLCDLLNERLKKYRQLTNNIGTHVRKNSN